MNPIISALLVLILALPPATPALAGGPAQDLVAQTFRLALDGAVPPGETFGVQYDTRDESGPRGVLILCGEGSAAVCKNAGTTYSERVTLPRGTRLGFSFFRRSDRIRDGGGLIGCCYQPFGGGEVTLTGDRAAGASYDFGRLDTGRAALTVQLTLDGDIPADQIFYVRIGEADPTRGVPRAQGALCNRREPARGACVGGGRVYTLTFPADYGYATGQTIRYRFERYNGSIPDAAPPSEVFGEGLVRLGGDTTIRAAYSRAVRCFAQTDRCIQGRFLAYWQANGGLATNGYPLGEEVEERLEDGRFYRVQYFERVRLEYHPEFVGTPAEVLLGQFGRRVFRARLGRDADPPAAPIAGQAYFPETGHNLGDGFLRYWGANGGLAQFGYPLSEVFVERLENGREYRVQYFERARFEYHPENQPPYDVLLGQFGRQILAESGADAGERR